MRLLRELRRRNVFKVAAVYAMVAFVVLQAADLLFPALLLPDWSFRLVAALTIVGFLIAPRRPGPSRAPRPPGARRAPPPAGLRRA